MGSVIRWKVLCWSERCAMWLSDGPVKLMVLSLIFLFFFFFNDTATTEIYTLSLHDALPICKHRQYVVQCGGDAAAISRLAKMGSRR